jgi:hypothetical protein
MLQLLPARTLDPSRITEDGITPFDVLESSMRSTRKCMETTSVYLSCPLPLFVRIQPKQKSKKRCSAWTSQPSNPLPLQPLPPRTRLHPRTLRGQNKAFYIGVSTFLDGIAHVLKTPSGIPTLEAVNPRRAFHHRGLQPQTRGV